MSDGKSAQDYIDEGQDYLERKDASAYIQKLEAALKSAEKAIVYYSGVKNGENEIANYLMERPYFYAIVPIDDVTRSHPNSSKEYPMSVAGNRARKWLKDNEELLRGLE